MIKRVMQFQENDNEFQFQNCLNWVILLLSLFKFIMKEKFHTWKSPLRKFIQDAFIGFVPLIPHFWSSAWIYNWNDYRRIRVKVILLRLESWFNFFGSKRQYLEIWVWNFKNKSLIWNQHLRNRIQVKYRYD